MLSPFASNKSASKISPLLVLHIIVNPPTFRHGNKVTTFSVTISVVSSGEVIQLKRLPESRSLSLFFPLRIVLVPGGSNMIDICFNILTENFLLVLPFDDFFPNILLSVLCTVWEDATVEATSEAEVTRHHTPHESFSFFSQILVVLHHL